MIWRVALLVVSFAAIAACSPVDLRDQKTAPGQKRIVSLDFCADQYVLKLADRKDIAALSPQSEAIHSYMRAEAKGIPKVRPRAEDILLLKPDLVVRSYGGGPNASAFFKRAGIDVVQIGYASDLAGVRQSILDTAHGLNAEERGAEVVAEMDARLTALKANHPPASILYLTSKGAVAGKNTMINEMLELAGFNNFQQSPGWGDIPLERLAYESPDVIAAGFFDTSDLVSDIWTPARHPVARRRLAQTPVIDLPGAWTACGGWFLLDAIEALAEHGALNAKEAQQ